MSIHAAIEKRIAGYLADDDPRFDWVRAAVRRHHFLPLYLGWVAVLGIRADLSFVCWAHEDDPEVVEPVTNAYLQRMAICQGVHRYPELTALVPARPGAARTCGLCKGSGLVPGAAHVVCECGGIGWILPGESQGPSPG